MTARRPIALTALALMMVLAAVAAGCSKGSNVPVNPPATVPANAPSSTASGTAEAGHASIIISDSGFTPDSVTVKVGSAVVWQNKGKAVHTVTFDDGSVKSPDIKPDGVATHVFTKAGTFAYHDSKFPQLTGTVIVTK